MKDEYEEEEFVGVRPHSRSQSLSKFAEDSTIAAAKAMRKELNNLAHSCPSNLQEVAPFSHLRDFKLKWMDFINYFFASLNSKPKNWIGIRLKHPAMSRFL